MVSIITNLIQDHSLNQFKLKNEAINQISEQIASGKRINSSSDDAAGLMVSTRLSSQISGNTMSGQNLGDGMSLSKVAESALGNIESVLQKVRELAIQSKNDTYNFVDKNNIQKEIDTLLDEIDYVSRSTTYNGIYVFDPSANIAFQNNYISSDNSIALPKSLISNTTWSENLQISNLATGLQVASNSFSPMSPLGFNGSFSLAGKTFLVQSNDSLNDIMQAINSSNSGVTASIDSSNKLVLTSNAIGAASAFASKDLTNETSTFSSSNPAAASIKTLYSYNDWSHNVTVSQLASGQEIQSNAQASALSPLGLSGQFTLSGSTFTVTDNMSATDIQNMINSANLGVTASISSGILDIKSNGIGANAAFTMTDLTNNSNVFSSSDMSVASTSSLLSNTDWSHVIDVTQLASAMQVESNSVANPTVPLNYSGSFKINGTTFTQVYSDSLTDIMNKINNAGIGVAASIVSNKLVLTANNTGNANAITATDVSTDSNIFSTSNTAVATTNTLLNNTVWSHNIGVSQLAQAMQVSSSISFANVNNPLNFSGAFTLNGVTFNVTDNMSLTDIQNMINTGSAGVTASISGGKLTLTSNTTGSSSTISTVDNTSFSNTFANSNPLIVSATNLSPTSEYSHTVEVDQLAKDFVSYNTTQTITDFNGTWKNGLGTWNTGTTLSNNSAVGTNISYLQNATTYTPDRSVEWDITINSGQTSGMAGATSHYLDNNNYVYAAFDIGTNQIVLGKVINGAKTEVRQNITTPLSAGQTYHITSSSDANGNFVVQLQNNTGFFLGSLTKSGWTDAVNVSGVPGSYTNGVKAVFDNFTVGSKGGTMQHQDAIYKVDGVSYTSSSNNIIVPDSQGNNGANVTFGNIGTAVISNSVTNAVMQSLGILSNSGAYTNVTKQAQDAKYTVDGANYISSSNANVNVSGDATIDLKGTGNTTVKNDITKAIMKAIGMITSPNTFVNVTSQAQDAVYKVDGVTYTNSANNNVLVKNSSGVSQAKINLLSLGTTTVSNTVDNAVLQTLGILNSSNGFNHLKSTAKDTIYSVDGTSYTASTNNGIMLSSGGVNQGTIDLKGIGTTTVSYNHTNSVLKDLGVIDNSGNYLNKRVNAQDASYSANGVSFTSSSNQILLKDNSGSSLGIVKLLKTGNVTISNTNSNEPKTLKIHAGYNYNDVFNVQLSDISTSSLGLSGLQISDSLLIDRIDGAINKVNKDQVKFGTYENTISERKDNLTTRTIDLQKSKSLIEDSNVAALYSEKIKNGILQQSTMATYKQSLDNTRLYLSLLSN